MIAVTGSDGKTTTTTIIAELLRKAGRTVHLGGNIGHPLLAETASIKTEDIAVLELSSFQLMNMKTSPRIAVTTNLSPNHLDVHKDFTEYVDAKANIFAHQTADELSVFNADNEDSVTQAAKAPGKVRWFSRRKELNEGVFLRGDAVICRTQGIKRQVMTIADIKLPGVHNIENYLAAIAALDGIVADPVICEFAREFGGVEHRIELVRIRNGVRWYNDSIASSPSRTIAGLRSFPEKVLLIVGGYDKHIPYDVLGPEICAHVKKLFLGGATGKLIQEAVVNCPEYDPNVLEIVDCGTFEPAVRAAAAAAQEGDVVLMSPASAAFDQFKNFMERGNYFKKLIMEL
jgi:UDP-N-acetylmuramoylalanine--D-glutamate ligase